MCAGSEISAADEGGDAFCPKSAYSSRELLLVRAVVIQSAVRRPGRLRAWITTKVLAFKAKMCELDSALKRVEPGAAWSLTLLCLPVRSPVKTDDPASMGALYKVSLQEVSAGLVSRSIVLKLRERHILCWKVVFSNAPCCGAALGVP